MINRKNKIKKMFSIAIVLMFAMSALFAASLQTVKAANVTTHIFIGLSVQPVGVGQDEWVTVWLDKYPPSHDTPAGYVKDATFTYTVTITDPNGNAQTKTLTSDFIGGASFNLLPTIVGTYTLSATFPQNNQTATTYLSSTRTGVQLVVQQQPILPIPDNPLPTEYWTRPIYDENRAWASNTGNWLLRAYDADRGRTYEQAFSPNTIAPNTAHIMWNKQLALGGLVGGESGTGMDYYSFLQYEEHFSQSIIINGRLYYNIPLGTNPSGGGFACVDLATGQELFRNPNGTLTAGQLLIYESLNQHGTIPYLWDFGPRVNFPTVPTYTMYDAFTGQKILEISKADPTFTNGGYDANGNIIIYSMGGSNPNRWLAMWNSTLCLLTGQARAAVATGGSDITYWRPMPGVNYNYTDGVQWNVTVPNAGANPSIQRVDKDDGILWARATIGVAQSADSVVVDIGYSMTDGHQIWVQNSTGDNALQGFESIQNSIMRDGYLIIQKEETKQYFAYNALTGVKLWETDPLTNDWGMYMQGALNLAYGKFYAGTYDGKIHAFDLKTGKQLWEYNGGNAGIETPYGSYPFYWFLDIADGKIFATNGEHSPNSPMYIGEKLQVIDANTGQGLWNISGWFQNGEIAIADGYLVGLNAYDMKIYSFGKGPSATSVSIQNDVVTQGSNVLIKGVVSDISAGTKQSPLPERFPSGVPAISDGFMTQWMEYLYEQQPKPANATGVTVFLQAMASNGTMIDITHVTSDITGQYEYAWQPPTQDTYKIIATFDGTQSYWGSSDECGLSVGPAASTINVPSASQVASQVVSQLPTPVPATPAPTMPSASDVASQVVSQLPSISTMDMLLLVVVVVIAVLVVVDILSVRKLRK